MKKLIYFCGLSLLATATLSSCLFEEDDIFDETAALRGQHYSDKITDVLFTPENGWVMQYFANADSKGYNIYARFYENGAVVLTSDHEYVRNNKSGAMVSDTSTYVLNEQDGPVLSFNSWNDILSVFTDPVDPESLAEDGEGLGGDNEFVVMQVNENDIIMRGERHEAEVRLVKCDRPQADYIETVRATESDILNSLVDEFFIVSQQDGMVDTIFTYDMNDGVFDFTNIQGEDRVDRSLAYICAPEGVRFQSEYAFDFYTVQGKDTTFWQTKSHELVYSADKNSLVNEDGTLTLHPNWASYVNSCINTNNKDMAKHVDFQQAEGCDQWKQLCADLLAAVKGKFSSQGLSKVTWGSSTESGSNKRTGLCFQTTNKISVAYPSTSTQEGDVVTFSIDTTNPSGNMKNYASKGIDSYFVAVAEYLNGSWKMTYDRAFNPQYVTLTSTTDASKVISLKVR